MVLENNKFNKNNIWTILSGVVISICFTLVLILLFALLIRYFEFSDKIIFPTNQVIKGISILFGCLYVLKKDNTNGFFKGIIIGLLYFIFSYIVFSILQCSFTFSIKNIFDLLLTTLGSGIIGIILVNLIK